MRVSFFLNLSLFVKKHSLFVITEIFLNNSMKEVLETGKKIKKKIKKPLENERQIKINFVLPMYFFVISGLSVIIISFSGIIGDTMSINVSL